jgi:hypothetical protein
MHFLPELLYEARFDENCISSQNRQQQGQLSEIIIKLRDCQGDAAGEAELLRQAASIRPKEKSLPRDSRDRLRTRARGNYWIARMLQKQRNPKSVHYLAKAIEQDPLFWRARLALLFAKLGVG